MVHQHTQARRLETLVEHYVDVRRRKHDCVSVTLAMRAIRQLTALKISDEALSAIIVRYAAKRGLAAVLHQSGSEIPMEPA